MAKGYWISIYRSIKNPDALAKYSQLAGPAIEKHGGKFLVRGMPAKVYEAGLQQRTVIIEFPSVDAALAAHDSPEYQAALKEIHGAAERDMRFVEGA